MQNVMDLKILAIKQAEADLLKHIGEELKKFFDATAITYREDGRDCADPDGSFSTVYRMEKHGNPRSLISPMAQVNMVANVTFHLMAQQLALLFLSKPQLSRVETFETAFDNVRALTMQYTRQIREEAKHEIIIEGHSAGQPDRQDRVPDIEHEGGKDQEQDRCPTL
jgi:hypothetical protein